MNTEKHMSVDVQELRLLLSPIPDFPMDWEQVGASIRAAMLDANERKCRLTDADFPQALLACLNAMPEMIDELDRLRRSRFQIWDNSTLSVEDKHHEFSRLASNMLCRLHLSQRSPLDHDSTGTA